MKKILGVAVLMAAGAALAATELDSSMLGFVPVAASGLTAVSVPVTGYTPGESIKIAEVLQTANLTAGDKLYTLNDDGTYNQYTLNSSKAWKPAKVVTVVGSQINESTADAPEVATVTRGKAFWIQTSAEQVNIMGQATTDAGSLPTLSTGWQMIGNPSMTTALKVSTITAPGSGSRLNVGANAYQKGKNGSWLKLPDYDTINDDDDVIPVGAGAMLLCK